MPAVHLHQHLPKLSPLYDDIVTGARALPKIAGPLAEDVILSVPMFAGAYVRQRSSSSEASSPRVTGSPRLGPALPPPTLAKLLGGLRAE